MNKLWNYMKLTLNPEELPTMKELLKEIVDNGGTDAALAKLREAQHEKYHNELIWRYPISQGDSAGGFIMPVREGILWIPYDEMEKEAGEILLTDNADLLTEDTCDMMADDFDRYADQLCDVLRQAAKICHRLEHGDVKRTLELGEFEVVSGKLAVSDPCYNTDVWCRGELENVMNGTWHASAVELYTGSWGRRIARLIAVHENYADEKMSKGQCMGFDVGVDSGQAGLFDASHYRDDTVIPNHENLKDKEPSEIWYDHCCNITLSPLSAGVLPYGVVSSSRYGDGSYDCFVCRNEYGQIIRAEIEFIPEDDYE